MKANELMIGDWVLVKEKPIQVEDIVPEGINTEWIAGCEYGGCIGEDEIRPIPITKELLEKNGFELDEVIKEYCIYNGIDNRVSIHNDKEYMNSVNEWHVHIDSEDYCTIAHCELTYLHELQHLLKLCNIDFEFDV